MSRCQVRRELDALHTSAPPATIVAIQSKLELVRKSKLKKQNDLSVAQNALSALLVNRDALQFWRLGFQEIRFQTMSEVIERWNALFRQEVNYLGFHADSTRLEVKGLQSSKRPEVDRVITRSGGDLQLEALSDGELRRVDLAAFLSLRQITVEYLGYNLELIVRDDLRMVWMNKDGSACGSGSSPLVDNSS